MDQRPIDKLLPLLRNVDKTSNGWQASCPSHEDDNPSLSIAESEDGTVVLNCKAGCTFNQVVYAVGLSKSDFFPEKEGKKKRRDRGKIVAQYDYFDSEGALLYQCCRMEPKSFAQRRPNGQGGWIWDMKNTHRVLYKVRDMLNADPSQPVFVVEGEKSVNRLWELNLVATTNVGGAGKWNKSYSAALKDRHVVILPDYDALDIKTGKRAGWEHAVSVEEQCRGIAKSVQICNYLGFHADTTPADFKKQDVDDWLDAGGSAAKLMEMFSAPAPVEVLSLGGPTSEEHDPLSTVYEEQLLQEIGLDVLGEVDGEKHVAKVFSEGRHKTYMVEIAKLTYERLEQICGPIVKTKIHRGNESAPGLHTVKEVKSAVSQIMGQRRIGDESEAGRGVWQGQDDDGEPNSAIVLVGAGCAAKWNGLKILERINKPRSGGRLLDLSANEPWFDFDTLADTLQLCTKEWAEQAVDEAIALFSKWRWKKPDQSPRVIVGLILATWVQTIWAWRPQVAIIGESNSGKSTLFEVLEGIFGSLCIKSSQSTAAGIRQAIRRSASVVLCDEFESGRHRDDILEMIRASSRGDKVLRGTTGHKGQEFTLRHIVWIAAIESGLKREPDRNRFITLELLPPLPQNAGKLICPSVAELNSLGQKLLAVAVRYALESRPLAVRLKSWRFPGVHSRVIESYSVPAAMLATLLGMDDADAAETALKAMLTTADASDTSEGDKMELLGDIMESIVDVGRGEKITVSQAVSAGRLNEFKYDTDLERCGVGVFDDGLFISHKAATRHLLRGTQWERQNIDQILRRFDGADKKKRRIAKSHPWGILIPWIHLEEQEGSDE